MDLWGEHMVENGKVKFNGIEWIKKKGLYVNNWKRKMDLTEDKLKNKVVLDAGCGSGYTTNYFSQFTKEINGIDISKEDIEEARNMYNARNLFFKVGSVEQIPFKDSTFDVVYSHWVIEHLKKPQKIIDEAYRVLKPRGIFILWVQNVKNIMGFLTKIISLSLKVQVLKILLQRNEVSHHKCYYRANSVQRLDKLCKGKFKRIYLERFDDVGYCRNFRILSYLWLPRHKLSNNKLLNWTHPHFYVEYKKCL